MVTLLVVGAIAWVLTGAVEDAVRAGRGQEPRTERRGLRGYLDDRWKALADHHHAVNASGLLTAADARAARKHLARTKALKLAGLATDEDVARARKEHEHRLGFIAKGIDPDTMPPLFPPRGEDGRPVPWEPPVEEPLAEPPSVLPDPEPVATVDDHYDSNTEVLEDHETGTVPDGDQPYTVTDVWINPTYFPPDHRLWGPDTTDSDDQPWSPYAPTDNTDTKENNTMSSTGEVNSPADVKQFHADLKAVMDNAVVLTDTLRARADGFEQQARDVRANLAATENAAAGMDKLGMTAAAAAAEKLMEIQSALADALVQLADAHDTAITILTDQTDIAKDHLAAILAAHDAQMTVKDTRDGAGRENLATDTYLDSAE